MFWWFSIFKSDILFKNVGFCSFLPLIPDTSDLFKSFLKLLRSLWGLFSSLELEERYTTVLFMGWPGVMKTGFEIKPNGSSENYGFVSVDKLPLLFLSFFFLKALPFFFIACCWLHHCHSTPECRDGSSGITIASTGERLDRCVFSFIALLSSSWHHRAASVSRMQRKIFDSINVQGYYVSFQKCVPTDPNPPWWIQAPDQIPFQSSFGFALCTWLHLHCPRFFFLLIIVISWKEKSLILSLLKVFAEYWAPHVSPCMRVRDLFSCIYLC